MVESDVINEVILDKRAENLGITAVRVDLDKIAHILNLGTKFEDVRYKGGLTAGEHHGIQKATPLLEESYLVDHPAVVRECQVRVVAVGTAKVAAIVPKDARGFLGIIQKGERRDIGGMNHDGRRRKVDSQGKTNPTSRPERHGTWGRENKSPPSLPPH